MCKVIGYDGYIFIDGFKDKNSLEEGIELGLDDFTPALMNNPLDGKQIGFVCDMNKCSFNKEAVELLKNVKLSGDDIGEIDAFTSDKGPIFSWMGGPLFMAKPSSITGSNSYEAALFDSVKIEEFEIEDCMKNAIKDGEENHDD